MQHMRITILTSTSQSDCPAPVRVIHDEIPDWIPLVIIGAGYLES